MHTLFILLKKEFIQFRRNKFIPKMVVMFPVMAMLVISLVTTMDVKNVNVAVVDLDKSETSRRIISDMEASANLTLSLYAGMYEDALRAVEKGDADVILQIPAEYEKELVCGNPPAISLAANGVNATKSQLGAQYLLQAVMKTLKTLDVEQGIALPEEKVFVQNRYNPTLDYPVYMIPALMIILIIMICGFLPALNLVSEKEAGTIEQINVSPVSRLTFTLSKLIPYWIIGLLVLTLAMVIAWVAYGLVPVGSIWIIYVVTLLFSFVMSGLGVSIANCSSTMQQSMYVMFFFIIIFQLMSGLMTPIDSMPQWAQYITYRYPAALFHRNHEVGLPERQHVQRVVAGFFYAGRFCSIRVSGSHDYLQETVVGCVFVSPD